MNGRHFYYFIAQKKRVGFFFPPLRKQRSIRSFRATTVAQRSATWGGSPASSAPCRGPGVPGSGRSLLVHLSYCWYEQSGRRDCSQIYFVGCSHGRTLLGFLHVPNRKADIPTSLPFLASPSQGDLTKTRRTERAEKMHGSSRQFPIP